ncbi:Threonylcarbamoyl-AMP synthase [Candidatus Defluviicoccus seviourii]|uniref:Threonylcarbamoyl-AMP synthase n=1 Tax=Candidatus Defluviicoccus seviourii TaxID=2565273 RepID=A0A564WGF5_9PROT|nr:Threonylcarbamoyl-AMP synthase [Candidatus Defluviicoccus seviourii]
MSEATTIARPTTATLAEACRLLRSGTLVAFPTETVYGLGADATSDAAVARIFAAKERPRFNPLIVHFATVADAEAEVELDARARMLAEAFWPGPLTLVLKRRPSSRLSLLVSAGLDTVAIRAPDHTVAQALIRAAGVPIAAPSANRFGHVSPTTAAHVADSLGGRVELILDGGPCRCGIESTILDLSGAEATVLRPGAVTAEALANVLGVTLGSARANDPRLPPPAPGMLRRHYAPGRPLRLNASAALPGEALIGFGPEAPADCLNLSRPSDLEEAAANLFATLRALDRPEVAAIAVMPIPEQGLGRAINDRLTRAAATDEPVPPDPDPFDHDRGPALPCALPDGLE